MATRRCPEPPLALTMTMRPPATTSTRSDDVSTIQRGRRQREREQRPPGERGKAYPLGQDITSGEARKSGEARVEGVSWQPSCERLASRGQHWLGYEERREASDDPTQQAVGFEGKTSYVWASMRIFGNGTVSKDRQNG